MVCMEWRPVLAYAMVSDIRFSSSGVKVYTLYIQHISFICIALNLFCVVSEM